MKKVKGYIPTGKASATTPKEVMGSQGVSAKVATTPAKKGANKAKKFPAQ